MNQPLPAGATTPLALRALDFVRSQIHPAILNHSMRTYLRALMAAEAQAMRPGRDFDSELLFCACIFHDIGTSTRFNGPQRFEIEGADAAATFLEGEHLPRAGIDQVWEAIALHTSPGIAERCGALTLLTRLGVRADFGRAPYGTPGQVRALELSYPRLDIEIVLGDHVVAQAREQPEKAPPGSWPGNLLRAYLADPDATGRNAGF